VELLSPALPASPSRVALSPPSLAAHGGSAGPSIDTQSGEFSTVDVMPSPPPATSAATSSGYSGSSSSRAQSNERNNNGHSPYRGGADVPSGRSPSDASPISPAMAAPSLQPESFERRIDFNDALAQQPLADGAVSPFPSNLVRTSQYTAYDFIPKNLFFQFMEISNLYFLFVSRREQAQQQSVSLPRPQLFPHFVALCVSVLFAALQVGILQAIPVISTTGGGQTTAQ
jgi:hypothetical protein